MKKIGLVLVLFLVSSLGFAQKYVVDVVIGDVVVRNKGKVKVVDVGYVLKVGDVLSTKEDSECYISVEGKGYIKVEENSSVSFEEISKSFGSGTKDSLGVVGSVIFSVKGIFSKSKVLNVKSDTAFATIRGTEFVVESFRDKTTIYVLEGRVGVAPMFTKNENTLIAKSIILSEGEKIEISEIDVINATSFINNKDEEGYGVFLNGKKQSLIESEKERFAKRMEMLREIQKKRLKELEKKKKEYLKDPSKLFEE